MFFFVFQVRRCVLTEPPGQQLHEFELEFKKTQMENFLQDYLVPRLCPFTFALRKNIKSGIAREEGKPVKPMSKINRSIMI